MSTTGRAWLLPLLVGAWPTFAVAQCTVDDRAAVATASGLMAQEAITAADEVLRAASMQAPGCDELAVAAWSLRAWRAARAASASGGRAEDLVPATEALARVAALGSAVSPAGYAVALVRAAIAASQDERDELQLWLDHARDLSQRLTIGATAPRWPRPFDHADGELWLEVDDYEAAEAAFARAVTRDPTAAAWSGLARSLDRQGQTDRACDAYRQVLAGRADDAADPLVLHARARVQDCGR